MKSLPLLEGVPKKSIDESQSKIEILFPTYTSETAELYVGNGNSGKLYTVLFCAIFFLQCPHRMEKLGTAEWTCMWILRKVKACNVFLKQVFGSVYSKEGFVHQLIVPGNILLVQVPKLETNVHRVFCCITFLLKIGSHIRAFFFDLVLFMLKVHQPFLQNGRRNKGEKYALKNGGKHNIFLQVYLFCHLLYNIWQVDS